MESYQGETVSKKHQHCKTRYKNDGPILADSAVDRLLFFLARQIVKQEQTSAACSHSASVPPKFRAKTGQDTCGKN